MFLFVSVCLFKQGNSGSNKKRSCARVLVSPRSSPLVDPREWGTRNVCPLF